MTWTLVEAVALCRSIEELAIQFDCHVALTGGTIFRNGARKDVDLVFYRVRQAPRIRVEELLRVLRDKLEIDIIVDNGFCVKSELGVKRIDLFFPERPKEEWPETVSGDYS